MPLIVLGLNDAAETFDTVVDTGFNDYVSLPPDVVNGLQLPFLRNAAYVIAGEREVRIPVHAAFVEFDGESFEIEVLAQEGEPLVGMALLTGFRLTVEATTGGSVTVERLP